MKYAMADGRAFTYWGPNCDITQVIQREMKFRDQNEVRQYLQQNAEKIMKQFRERCDENVCPVCHNFLGN